MGRFPVGLSTYFDPLSFQKGTCWLFLFNLFFSRMCNFIDLSDYSSGDDENPMRTTSPGGSQSQKEPTWECFETKLHRYAEVVTSIKNPDVRGILAVGLVYALEFSAEPVLTSNISYPSVDCVRTIFVFRRNAPIRRLMWLCFIRFHRMKKNLLGWPRRSSRLPSRSVGNKLKVLNPTWDVGGLGIWGDGPLPNKWVCSISSSSFFMYEMVVKKLRVTSQLFSGEHAYTWGFEALCALMNRSNPSLDLFLNLFHVSQVLYTRGSLRWVCTGSRISIFWKPSPTILRALSIYSFVTPWPITTYKLGGRLRKKVSWWIGSH